MQLDKTRIAIRERSFGDILDLSLRVIRVHAPALSLALAVGIVPVALLNHWWLSDSLAATDITFEWPWLYFYRTVLLIVWLTPLATAPATLYLGQALFIEKPSAARVLTDFWSSLPQLLLFQVALRGMLVLTHLLILVLYGVWPYLNEILLLERNPWRRKRAGGKRVGGESTLGRTSIMHARSSSELFSRWFLSVVLGLALILVIWGSILYLRYWLTWQTDFGSTVYTVHLQVAIWIVIGYFTVVRFLSYLDLRIRTEGWEVELAMRAEANRLTRQLT